MNGSSSGDRGQWAVVEGWRWWLRAAAVVALLLSPLGADRPRFDVGVILSPHVYVRTGALVCLACLIGSFAGRRHRRPATDRDAWRKPLRTLLVAVGSALVGAGGLFFLWLGAFFDAPVARVGEPSPGGCQAYVSYDSKLFGHGSEGHPFLRQPGELRLRAAGGSWETGRDGFDPRGRVTVRWEGRDGVITVATPGGDQTMKVTCPR